MRETVLFSYIVYFLMHLVMDKTVKSIFYWYNMALRNILFISILNYSDIKSIYIYIVNKQD